MEISVWYGWCLCAQLSTKNGISIFFLPYQTNMVGVYVHGYSGYSVLVFPQINAVIVNHIALHYEIANALIDHHTKISSNTTYDIVCSIRPEIRK